MTHGRVPKASSSPSKAPCFPGSPFSENVMFGLNGQRTATSESLADHYAAMVGLRRFRDELPARAVGRNAEESELARALVVKPEILYMDEPLAALDALTSLRMRIELLRILCEGAPYVSC